MHAPREPHLITIKRIFRSLKGTLDLGLHFVPMPLTALHGFYDANWAGVRMIDAPHLVLPSIWVPTCCHRVQKSRPRYLPLRQKQNIVL